MLGFGLAVLLAATPAPGVRKLAAPGFDAVNLDAKVANSFVLHFTQQLTRRGFSVTTPQEVAAVLGLERQKELLGCTDSTACSVEIAGALGVDAVITGNISKTSSGYLLNVKIIRSTDASAVEAYSGRPRTDEEVLDFLETSAAQFAASQGLAGSAVATGGAGSGPGIAPWLVGGVGIVGLGVGIAFLGVANSTADTLARGEAADAQGLTTLKQQGQTQEVVGWVALAAGGAALATSVVLFIAHPKSPPTAAITVVPTPNGAVLGLGGVF